MADAETIRWIKGTPLGVAVRRISFIAPHAHENMIEITMCLEGSITFDYCFEEFRLKEGEFILVDRDTHYMHSGDCALCASVYLDLNKVSSRYGEASHQMFVCEGTSDSTNAYNTQDHKQLRGMLIAIFDYLLKYSEADDEFVRDMERAADGIMNLIYYRFDIVRWRKKDIDITEKTITRMKTVVEYMFHHYTEKITLKDVADYIGVSPGYMSVLFSKNAMAFEQAITYIRTWHAERLLLTTDDSIANISDASGFSASKYMYAGFRFWYNCTPGEYRMRYRREMQKQNESTEIDIQEASDSIIRITNEQLISMYIKGEE